MRRSSTKRRAAMLVAALVATASSATTLAAAPRKVIDEEHCFSEPVPANRVPDRVSTEFGMGNPVFGWGALWSVAPEPSWLEPVTPDRASGDTAIAGLKLAWYRLNPGRVDITVETVPSTEEQLQPGSGWVPLSGTATVLDGYGLRGLQVSGVEFPAAGCWAITGNLVRVDSGRVISTLSFLLWVPEPGPNQASATTS